MVASEQTYRLYNCARCAEQVRICRGCDRGNRYCPGGCAGVRRRESLCRAGARYQGSYRGAYAHAARQRAWRERQAQEVTHQGSLLGSGTLIVAASPTQTTTQGTHAHIASVEPRTQAHNSSALAIALAGAHLHAGWLAHRTAAPRLRCGVCGGVLPRFARLGPLRGGL
jgi:hypothetical protein